MSVERAQALVELNRPAEALEQLSLSGADVDAPRALGIASCAHLALGDPSRAARSAEQLREAAPDWEWGYRLGALAELRRHRLRAARDLADAALALDAEQAGSYEVLALVHLQTGDHALAEEHARHVQRLQPDDADSHVLHARVLLGRERALQAQEAAQRALALAPDHPHAPDLLSRALALQGRHEEARQWQVRSVRAAPQDAERRRRLLGGTAVVGSIGLGKLFLPWIGVRTADLALGPAIVAALVVVAYAGAFAVVRHRRQVRGRDLPPGFWEGLAPERRNEDLRWIAWPAAFLVAIGLLMLPAQLVRLRPDGFGLGALALGTALLALCWRLRQGELRQRSVRDVLCEVGLVARFLRERRRARRG